ncbi:zinc finger, CCHC-type, Gag-polypeptide of LTR copia-type [Artemisia annua]|uniref:Zinc finger, CCHC-type, Gag-polypeptide of LTR copia-type n=1 Tax=Artemisia annua TaxID=35608 RepID=A0A2U1P4A8_ARTAN|nr:zinc finger, CCHC-type, Gag-polypeptide of LTR copia-type [Artemisia annua]
MAETLGHTTARAIWCALEAAYSHDSVELNGSTVQPVAFNTTTRASTRQQTEHSSSHGRGRNNYSNRGGSSRGRGRGYRRPPHCQLCRQEGHYATQCPDLNTFASRPAAVDANLARAFQAQCNMVSTPNFDELKAICGSEEIKDCFKFLFGQEESLNEGFIRKVVEWSDGLHEKIAKFGAMIEEGEILSLSDPAAADGTECLIEAQARNGVMLQAVLRLFDVLREARTEKRRHVMVMEVHD